MLASCLMLLTTTLLAEAQLHDHILSDKFIARLNQANSTWKAGRK